MLHHSYQSLLLPKIKTLLKSTAFDDVTDNRRCHFQAALHYWHQLQLLFTTDEKQREAFELLLDVPQQKSWGVLNDWWHGRYYVNKLPSRDNDSLLRLLKASELLQEATKDSRATYEDSLLHLFVVELVWCQRLQSEKASSHLNVECSDPQHDRRVADGMRRARSEALRFTTWQMIGHASFLEFSAKQEGRVL